MLVLVLSIEPKHRQTPRTAAKRKDGHSHIQTLDTVPILFQPAIDGIDINLLLVRVSVRPCKSKQQSQQFVPKSHHVDLVGRVAECVCCWFNLKICMCLDQMEGDICGVDCSVMV